MNAPCGMLDYLEWRGDLPLSRVPFNEIDNLILSMASFLNFDGIVPEGFSSPVLFPDAVRAFLEKPAAARYFGLLIPERTADLVLHASETARFRDAYVTGFRNHVDNESETQFCAVTFLLPDKTLFISIRGTDDTLVGWKENLNLALSKEVPAERAAVDYVTEAAKSLGRRFYVGGHSKGGHLALYAAIHADKAVQNKLCRAYSNDGPGFTEETFDSPAYHRVEDRIFTYIPQSSIVGEIFRHGDRYAIIESTGAGILQHDPFTWSVKGASFVTLPARSAFGKASADGLRAWIATLSDDDRVFLIKTIDALFSAAGDKTLTEIGNDFFRFFGEAHKTFLTFDRETRQKFVRLMGGLLREYRLMKAENINLFLQNPLKIPEQDNTNHDENQ